MVINYEYSNFKINLTTFKLPVRVKNKIISKIIILLKHKKFFFYNKLPLVLPNYLNLQFRHKMM